MSDFDERWQQSEREYTSNSEELLSILRVIPQISQNQRDDYQQRGQTCLKNMERAVTDLTQILRQNRSTSAQKDQYRQQLNVSKQQIKSQRNDFNIALQKQRFNNNKFETEKKFANDYDAIAAKIKILVQDIQYITRQSDIIGGIDDTRTFRKQLTA
eukprot:424083_1